MRPNSNEALKAMKPGPDGKRRITVECPGGERKRRNDPPPKPRERKPKEKPPVCVHLGAATGDVELVQCRTCRGNVRQKLPLTACAVHGICLPSAAADATTEAMACARCRKEGLGFEAAESQP